MELINFLRLKRGGGRAFLRGGLNGGFTVSIAYNDECRDFSLSSLSFGSIQ